jgi:hypothetical protein
VVAKAGTRRLGAPNILNSVDERHLTSRYEQKPAGRPGRPGSRKMSDQEAAVQLCVNDWLHGSPNTSDNVEERSPNSRLQQTTA